MNWMIRKCNHLELNEKNEREEEEEEEEGEEEGQLYSACFSGYAHFI